MTIARTFELRLFLAKTQESYTAICEEMWEARVSIITTMGSPVFYIEFKDGSQYKNAA